MKKKLKHLLWIKFCSISLLTAKVTVFSIIKAKNDSAIIVIFSKWDHSCFNFYPSAQKAAAAIDVGVGFDNPVKRRSAKHVLFLGNKKYPE